jgi:hypothetical protein
VLTDTRPDYSQIIHQIQQLHLKILQQVASAGSPMSGEQHRRLQIVNDAFGAATRRWLTGVSSAAEARFEIRVDVACSTCRACSRARIYRVMSSRPAR